MDRLKTFSPWRSAFVPCCLFALYPVLFLYQQNIREVSPGEIVPPLALSVVMALALWLGSRPLYPDKTKRALAVLAAQAALYYYKYAFDLLQGFSGRGPWARRAPHLIILLFLALLLLAIHRSRQAFLQAHRIARIVLLALLALNLGGVLIFHVHDVDKSNARDFIRKSGLPALPPPAARPDIYCFILDEFASLETSLDVFQYDNSGFARRLQDAGFFIAGKSRGLYAWTAEAIAALLNMERLPARTDAGLLVRQNKATRFLKGLGYRIFDFPTAGPALLDDAEEHLFYARKHASIFLNDFYRALIEMSAFYTLADHHFSKDSADALFFRERISYVFEQMPAFVKKAGPKFALVHLFSPHAPFVFDRQGGAVAPRHHTDYSDRRHYLDQYIYISRRMAETAEMILKESAAPPIIILLSDHGYRGSFRKPLLHVVAEAEKRKIFLGLHLPGFPHERLDPALSPLDVFRIVFNHYFARNPAGDPV